MKKSDEITTKKQLEKIIAMIKDYDRNTAK